YQIVNLAPPAPSAVNRAVPQLLDYVVAKMLAKALDERYQDAAEVARDLRECERQLGGPPASTLPPSLAPGLAAGTAPQLLDTNAKTVVLAQTLNRTRGEDHSAEGATAPPARGLAHAFDSMEATQRLAALTGATGPAVPEASATRPETATQAIESLRRAPRPGWRRRDWLAVAGAGVLGLLAARAIVRRQRE
ncbi:MAG: hypothetical protein JO035_16735, partial [Betaproteobacteria bacterium]|nr:hypothetical protein [Betaproteobacteria bacterium]